ncbi:hypothetical protein KEM54_003597 [Ascosphaera aggregata]|nr:hypothetical protein KEM54_003597 [Ascosphaera aggregata]
MSVYESSMPYGAYRKPAPDRLLGDAQALLVDDTYHLFSMNGPSETYIQDERLKCGWEHYVSKDLVHWTRKAKSGLWSEVNDPKAPDHHGIWAGCVINAPDGNMHLYYAGYDTGHEGQQLVIRAKAADKHGELFTKDPEPIKISEHTKDNLLLYEPNDFRDPYIRWIEEEQKYFMLISSLRVPCGVVAVSTWDVEPKPLYAPNDVNCPECSELFKMNGKWFLTFSRYQAPNAGTVYRVADSPRGPFRRPRDNTGMNLDARRWYAAKSCEKPGCPDKRIYFGWISDRNPEDDGMYMWGGVMLYPREVTATSVGTLRIDMPQEIIDGCFEKKPYFSIKNRAIKCLGAVKSEFIDCPSDLKTPAGQLLAFRATPTVDTAAFGVLLRSDKDHQGVWVSFWIERKDKDTFFYRVAMSYQPFPLDDWTGPHHEFTHREIDGTDFVSHNNVAVPANDNLVRIMLTGDVIEIFVGGKALTWRYSITEIERKNEGNHIGLFVDDGEVVFESFEAFKGVESA